MFAKDEMPFRCHFHRRKVLMEQLDADRFLESVVRLEKCSEIWGGSVSSRLFLQWSSSFIKADIGVLCGLVRVTCNPSKNRYFKWLILVVTCFFKVSFCSGLAIKVCYQNHWGKKWTFFSFVAIFDRIHEHVCLGDATISLTFGSQHKLNLLK